MSQDTITLTSPVKELIASKEKEMIAFRRHLHANPEVSLEEFETTKTIAAKLDELDISYRLTKPTGVIAEIKGARPGKTVLLRADMDALSVQQLNEVDYKSVEEGKMHACGHDAHVSMLMNAAYALNEVKDTFEGTVRLVFQPAEEIAEGAKLMVEQGAVDGVDNAFGIHIWAPGKVGTVSCPAGPSFAAADIVKVDFVGSGGHAAQPHLNIDAAIMASQYVANVQSIVSRVVDPMQPAVVTLGKMEVGTRFNVIAENAHIEGTVRTFDPATRDKVEECIKHYAEEIARMYGGKASVEYQRMTEPVNNEERTANLVQEVAAQAFGETAVDNCPPTMGGEDFGYYMLQIPGAFATVGSGNPDKDTCWPHHSGRFNVDEEALKVGAELYAQYALAYLAQDQF
ncbi:amidohydrolase [Desemzia sp. RIT 804]|uniref:amidohydrolase n=1 Tax=Desemzia sp. RIT 804 TaxID=2810209 RepID=UPI001F35D5AE|nr:amidohydrolase [Desemzia sp. RIT 804]